MLIFSLDITNPSDLSNWRKLLSQRELVVWREYRTPQCQVGSR